MVFSISKKKTFSKLPSQLMPMTGVISGVVTPKDKTKTNPLARQKVRTLDIIPCFNVKWNPIFYFIYIHSYCRNISLLSLVFLRYIQNNLEYLMQNMIHQVDQMFHSMLELIFSIYCFCMTFLYFSMCSIY